MAREPEHGCIAGELVPLLDHRRCAPLDGLPEFATSVMAVDAPRQRIAPVEIPCGGPAHGVSRHGQSERRSPHECEQLTDPKPEPAIQTERPVVIRGLDETNPPPVA